MNTVHTSRGNGSSSAGPEAKTSNAPAKPKQTTANSNNYYSILGAHLIVPLPLPPFSVGALRAPQAPHDTPIVGCVVRAAARPRKLAVLFAPPPALASMRNPRADAPISIRHALRGVIGRETFFCVRGYIRYSVGLCFLFFVHLLPRKHAQLARRSPDLNPPRPARRHRPRDLFLRAGVYSLLLGLVFPFFSSTCYARHCFLLCCVSVCVCVSFVDFVLLPDLPGALPFPPRVARECSGAWTSLRRV